MIKQQLFEARGVEVGGCLSMVELDVVVALGVIEVDHGHVA